MIKCLSDRTHESEVNEFTILLPRLGEADFCTDDAATLLVRLARIANVLSLWLKSEPIRAWKKSKTGWDGYWLYIINNRHPPLILPQKGGRLG